MSTLHTKNIRDKLFARSGRLFANPSFFRGVARTLDLGSTMNEYNQDETGYEADFQSLLSDWYAVGDAIYNASVAYEKDHLINSK